MVPAFTTVPEAPPIPMPKTLMIVPLAALWTEPPSSNATARRMRSATTVSRYA